jgi:hypothetical protein
MSMVKVWNDSTRDYQEIFKGNEIYIRSSDYVEMTRADAVSFQGSYSPARKDGVGRNLNEKKIRLEFDWEAEAIRKDQPIKYNCEITGESFRTIEAWSKHQQDLASAKPESPEVQNAKKNTRGKPTSRGKQPVL